MANGTHRQPPGIATYVLFGGILGLGINILIELCWPAYLHGYHWLHILVIFVSILVFVCWRVWRFRKQHITDLIIKNAKGEVIGEIKNRQSVTRGINRLWHNPVEGWVKIEHSYSDPIIVIGHCTGDLTVKGTADIRHVSVGGTLTTEGNVSIRASRVRGDIVQNV